MAWNARLLVVGILVAGRAAHRDRPLVVGAADHQRRVRMAVVALRRPLTDRMAILAARMLQDPTRLDEQRARTFGGIRYRRERLRPSQILGAGERPERARENHNYQR